MQELAKKDKWGYLVHTSSDDCIDYLNQFYHQILSYGSHKKVILQAAGKDQSCTLANALAAWYMMSVDPSDAQHFLDRSKQTAENATDYERAVLEALQTMASGNPDEALCVHLKLLERFPKDLASLKRAQVLGFSRGRSDLMLKFASQALHENLDAPYMHGMLAFALVEVGRTDEAEAAATKALSIEQHDVWAQHAMCHVLQEREHFDQAVSFMKSNTESWEDCGSFLYSHNWWHLAVCQLECDSLEESLKIFDTRIWGNRERAEKDLFMVSLNALGLLICIEVKGLGDCITERLLEIAQNFTDESKWHKEWLLDLLVIWSLARCSYNDEAKQLMSALRSRVHLLGGTEEIRKTILALASALYEYGSGNKSEIPSILGTTFNTRQLKVIGASNEQMRVFGEIWLKATSS